MKRNTAHYNYEALKVEFFTSLEKSPVIWWRGKYGKNPSGGARPKIKDWGKEKLEWLKNAVDEVKTDMKNSARESIRPDIEELQKKLGNVLKLVDLSIKSIYESAFDVVYDKEGNVVWQIDANGEYLVDEKGARKPLTRLARNVSASELKRVYEIIKCELGEPSNITNNRLSDPDGKSLPLITGIEVEIVRNTQKKT